MDPNENNEQEAPTPGLEAAGAAVGLQQAAAGFDAIRDLLAAIVVLDEYQIADVFGNSYSFRPVLSARRQIEAALRIDEFVRRNMDGSSLEAAQEAKARGGIAAGITAFLSRCLEVPEVQDDLQAIFRAIHPRILTEAQAAAAAAGEDSDHVLDLFELADLLEALVPFFARSATRIATVLSSMGRAEAVGSPKPSPASPQPQSVR